MSEPLIAHTRLWETADGRLVEEGDPAAAYLVATEGVPVPAATVQRLGLSGAGGKVVQKEGPPPGASVPSTVTSEAAAPTPPAHPVSVTPPPEKPSEEEEPEPEEEEHAEEDEHPKRRRGKAHDEEG